MWEKWENAHKKQKDNFPLFTQLFTVSQFELHILMYLFEVTDV